MFLNAGIFFWCSVLLIWFNCTLWIFLIRKDEIRLVYNQVEEVTHLSKIYTGQRKIVGFCNCSSQVFNNQKQKSLGIEQLLQKLKDLSIPDPMS